MFCDHSVAVVIKWCNNYEHLFKILRGHIEFSEIDIFFAMW